LKAGEARGRGAQPGRPGFLFVRVGLRPVSGGSQGLSAQRARAHGTGPEGEARAGEALREVGEHGIDGGHAAARLVGRLSRVAGQLERGVLRVLADWRERGSVDRVGVVE
jgi:hypothetical protein